VSLFTPYEKRPPFCQAAKIWFDTIEDIARYYGDKGGYEATTRRTKAGITLHIVNADDRVAPCDLTIELPYSALDLHTDYRMQKLVYGHPPTVVDEQDFDAEWREAKQIP
jgi:hypothetical protein